MKYEDIIYYERRDAAEEATLHTQVRCICELLEEYGTIPQSLTERLENEKDTETLAKWHKQAAKAHSIEEFIQKMDEGL